MKKFQTVTEKELLEMACDELLRRFLRRKRLPTACQAIRFRRRVARERARDTRRCEARF